MSFGARRADLVEPCSAGPHAGDDVSSIRFLLYFDDNFDDDEHGDNDGPMQATMSKILDIGKAKN